MPFGNSTIAGQVVRDSTKYNPVLSRLRPTDVPPGSGGGFTSTINSQTIRSVNSPGRGMLQRAVLWEADLLTFIVPCGTLTLTELYPSLVLDLVVPPGSMTLGELFPVADLDLIVPPGALTLTGFDPLVNSGGGGSSVGGGGGGSLPVSKIDASTAKPKSTLNLLPFTRYQHPDALTNKMFQDVYDKLNQVNTALSSVSQQVSDAQATATSAIAKSTSESSGGSKYIRETPKGVTDGSNQYFYLSKKPAKDSLTMVVNGLIQWETIDYIIVNRVSGSNGVVKFITAPSTGAWIIAIYTVN